MPEKVYLLVSLELDEVMNVSDRILVMYEGEIVGEFDPKEVIGRRTWTYTWQVLRERGQEQMNNQIKKQKVS